MLDEILKHYEEFEHRERQYIVQIQKLMDDNKKLKQEIKNAKALLVKAKIKKQCKRCW